MTMPPKPQGPLNRIYREGHEGDRLKAGEYFLPNGVRIGIAAGATGIKVFGMGYNGREFHRHELRKVRWWHRPCVVCDDGRICICWSCLWKLAVSSAVGGLVIKLIDILF